MCGKKKRILRKISGRKDHKILGFLGRWVLRCCGYRAADDGCSAKDLERECEAISGKRDGENIYMCQQTESLVYSHEGGGKVGRKIGEGKTCYLPSTLLPFTRECRASYASNHFGDLLEI